MPAYTPEAVHQLFALAFNARDLDALVALYEPDATLMPQPGQTVSGYAAIREAFRGFLAIRGAIRAAPPEDDPIPGHRPAVLAMASRRRRP